MTPHRPLRQALQSAVNQRIATLWTQRSHIRDIHALRAAVGRAEVFLDGYPVAKDERVLDYVERNTDDIGRILLSTNKGPLMVAYREAVRRQQAQRTLIEWIHAEQPKR
jgi:hypothetical protein